MKINKEAIKTVALTLLIGVNVGFIAGVVYSHTSSPIAQAQASK